MQFLRRAESVVLALVMLFVLAVPTFAVETTEAESDEVVEEAQPEVTAESSDVVKAFINANGRVLSVAKNGNVRKFPANSLEGINNCIELGIDIITVTVQKTKDDKLVLLTGVDLGPYCCNAATGDAVAGSTTDWNLDELQNTFALKSGTGGASAEATVYKVASLEDAIKAAQGKAMIMVDNGFEHASEINALAVSLNACDTVVLRGATSASEIKDFISSTGGTSCYIAGLYIDEKDVENDSSVEDLLAAGASCVELRSSKEKSSLWKEKTLGSFETNGRAFVSLTETNLCGGKQDRSAGWEELIGLGVSIIETDYPEELADFLSNIEGFREDIVTLISNVKALDTKNYTKESVKNLEVATEAAEDAVWEGTTTYNEMEEARYVLQEAIDNLEVDTTNGKTSLPGWLIFIIVIVSIIALLALVVVGLRIYNKVRYKKRDLEEFKDVFQSEVPTENDETLSTNIEEDEESLMGIEEVEEEIDEEMVEISIEEEPEQKSEDTETKSKDDSDSSKEEEEAIPDLFETAKKNKPFKIEIIEEDEAGEVEEETEDDIDE